MPDSSTNLPFEITEVQDEKDLGIWCTKDLKPSLQCRKAAAKAMQVLGLLRRSFKLFSVDFFVQNVCQTSLGVLHPGLEPLLSERY